MTSYGKQARSAVLWDTGFNLFRDVLQFVQMLILARLLTPQAYGQFGFVTGVVGFLTVFSARSFLAYALQVRSDEETHYQDQFTASVLLQLSLVVVTNLVAIGLTWFEEYASVAPVLHVMSLSFVLDLGGELRRKMLERQFEWKSIRLLHGAGLIVSTLTAILLAWLGAGVYALVFPGMLVTLPFIYDLFVRQKWRPTWQWSWSNYRSAFRFGLSRIGAGAAVTGRQLLETSVLAATIGFGPLGIVNRAVGLSQMACGKLGFQLMSSIYPVLTRLDAGTGQAAAAGDLLLRLVSWVTIPIAFCLGVLAVPVIRTVYGEQWMSAAPLLGWVLVYVVSSTLLQVVNLLSLARQKARACLFADIMALAATAACLWWLLPFGIVEYFTGLIGSYQAILWGLIVILVRAGALTTRGVILAVGPPLVTSLVIVVAQILFAEWKNVRLDTFWPAAVWGTCFFASYLVGLRFAFAGPLSEMISYFPGRAAISRIARLPVC